MLVRGHYLVEFLTDILHGGVEVGNGYVETVQSIIVRIDESHNLSVSVHYQTFRHERHVVEFSLDFLRIYILTRRCQNHGLGPAAQEQGAVRISCAHIAGMQPAILIKHCCGGFRILIISFHHVRAAHTYLSRDILRILRVYAALHIGERPTRRSRYEVAPGRVGNQRPALRHAVTDSEREPDSGKKILHLMIKGSTTHNHLLELAAKSVDQLFPDFGIDERVKERHRESPPHRTL